MTSTAVMKVRAAFRQLKTGDGCVGLGLAARSRSGRRMSVSVLACGMWLHGCAVLVRALPCALLYILYIIKYFKYSYYMFLL
jgi:hypothetical protein